MGLIVNFSDFENISASNLSFNDYLIGYATNPNREVRTTIEDLINFMESASANDLYQLLASSSANWNSTYTSVAGNSSKWDSTYTSLNTNSGNYESTYTTVNSLSDSWEESVYIAPLQAASASWNSTYSSLNANSGKYESTYTTVNFMSANNASVYSSLNTNSGNYESTYTTVNFMSANNASVYTSLNTNSAKYESTYTSLNTNSAKYESTYTTLNANSANYILDGGNTKGANISIGTNDAYNLSLETNAVPRLLITSDTLSGNTSKTSFGAGFATGTYSHAEGRSTLASGNYSHAEGQDSNASGESSHAEGFDNATGRRNDFLTYTAATRTFTFANTVSANFSYVSNGTVLRGFENSTLNGFFNITIASRDTGTGAISATADAIGANSSSGYLIDNKGSWAHAEGYSNTATGEDSHAEGYDNTASGDDSHAEGYGNTSSGLRSHAEGVANKASGVGSHAQGFNTIASGDYSHTQGADTLASASRSTATGQFTSATKVTSYASGRLALADHNRSWVWQGTNQDGVSAIFTSTRSDQFAIRPTNGFFLSGAMGINTDSIANALTVVGTISTNAHKTSQDWAEAYTNLNSNSANWNTAYNYATTYPLLTTIKTNNISLSSSSTIYTKVLTVPADRNFIATGLTIIFDSGAFTNLFTGAIRLTRNNSTVSTNRISNDLNISGSPTTFAANTMLRKTSNSDNNVVAQPGEIVQIVMSTLTSPYTASVITEGILY